MSAESPEQAASKDRIEAPTIGGVLYLVAIGVVVSPILNAMNLKSLLSVYWSANWTAVQAQGEMAMLAMVFEGLIQVFMLAGSIFLFFQFWGRKKGFPRWLIAYLAVLFGLGVIGAVIAAAIPGLDRSVVVESVAFPLKIFLMCVVWIPYFLLSKRVKQTFVA